MSPVPYLREFVLSTDGADVTFALAVPVAHPKARVERVATVRALGAGVLLLRDLGELTVVRTQDGIGFESKAELHLVVVRKLGTSTMLPAEAGALLGTFTDRNGTWHVFARRERRAERASPPAESGADTSAALLGHDEESRQRASAAPENGGPKRSGTP